MQYQLNVFFPQFIGQKGKSRMCLTEFNFAINQR